MADFQDITPTVVCFETDIGALGALMDDPILLRRGEIEADPSRYFETAKLRGVDDLRKALSDGPSFVPIVVAAGLSYCDECHAAPEEPCVSDDGKEVVPFHKPRLDNTRKVAKEIVEAYMAEGVAMDGPPS